MENTNIIWKYQHYKWNYYEVISIAHHSETLEELVVYKALYNHSEFWENSIWVRPKEMFFETIIKDWIEIPRFKYVWDVN